MYRTALSKQEPKWKQISVISTTRSDVERLLGKSKDNGYIVFYPLEEGSLHIEYSAGLCNPNQDGWDVQEWTVIEVMYTPFKAPPKFSDLKLDLSKFKKELAGFSTPGIFSYINEEEGIRYTVEPDGTVMDIVNFPSSRYNNIHCSSQ
jgi:hypothetical protein